MKISNYKHFVIKLYLALIYIQFVSCIRINQAKKDNKAVVISREFKHDSNVKTENIDENPSANNNKFGVFNDTSTAESFLREQSDSILSNLLNYRPSPQSIAYYITSTASKYVFKHYVVPALAKYFAGKSEPEIINVDIGRNDDDGVSRDGWGWGGHHSVNLKEPGGIAFPSLEGALLSLAFLTFAVFLVDLVQQVIGRLKTGAQVPLLGKKRKRRNIIESMEKSILFNHPAFSTLSSNVITAIENPLFIDDMMMNDL